MTSPLGRLIILLWGLTLALPGWAWAWGQPLTPTPEQSAALTSVGGAAAGEIVFATRRDGPWRLYRILPNGSGLTRLSQGLANERKPYFCQGGTKLVFESDRAGLTQIWRANPDLTQAELLSPQGQAETLHGISEDGNLLLLGRDQTPQGFYLRRLDDGGQTHLDFGAMGMSQGSLYPLLSPDGLNLGVFYDPEGADNQPIRGVYWAELDEDHEIFAPWLAVEGCGTGWKPDSKYFLTVIIPEGQQGSQLWLVPGHTPTKTQLTPGQRWDYFPAFGPAGQWMTWAQSPLNQHDFDTGNYEVMIRSVEGEQEAQLTYHSAPDVEPAWRAGVSDPPPLGVDRYWQGEQYAGDPGQVWSDGAASQGQAVHVSRDAGAGVVVYGQYDHLPAGNYEAAFMLKKDNSLNDGVLARLEVAQAGVTLASRELRPSQLSRDSYQALKLEFSLGAAGGELEYRVAFSPQVADLWVDYIQITSK